ncbi:MAG: DUF2249 domain-containing protein [Acidimicrobiales bacterium]
MTENDAFQAMLAHHRSLGEAVAGRVVGLRAAVEGGNAYGAELAAAVSYLAEEVLPHAAAEERSVYQAARDLGPDAAEMVAGMVDEHRFLALLVERLAAAKTGTEALGQAETISSSFAGHVRKENELLLPPLAAAPGVDLAGLLAQMQALTEAAQSDNRASDNRASDNRASTAGADPESALAALLLEAGAALADAGQGERACRLVASGWAVLRKPRPDLAVRLTAALHRLVRSVSAEPVRFTPGPRPAGSGAGGDAELDVRPLAPAQRHEKIFAAYGALAPGTSFVLVNDHDPKPLRYQFEAEHSGEFSWEVLEEGPRVWRARIGRPAVSGTGPDGQPGEGAEPELDVRRFPHGQRHDVIFTTYGTLAPGRGFVLVNDHDPKPLRYQFEAQYSGQHTWDYLEEGPQIWRVRIGRVSAVAVSR